MKLLSVTVPCYNSQAYMEKAVDSLLAGGEEVEILIVDDGSTDRTGAIAEDYQSRYPGIVRAIYQENGGHGDAVMTGLKYATGLYFKVLDSDDWADAEAYPKVLDRLRGLQESPVDMLISNYIYDKAGARHKKVIRYRQALPQDRVFGWEETRHFSKGHYILMHSVIYRTQLLRDCGLSLPRHTFYVDELYVYLPLTYVEKIAYLDVDLYHYFIGRDDQSVQEQVMIRRIDQVLLVHRMLVSAVDPFALEDRHKRRYMLNFLEIITIVASVLLIRSGTKEHLQKKEEMWAFIKKENPRIYHTLRRRMTGRVLHLPGPGGRALVLTGYRVCQWIFGFN